MKFNKRFALALACLLLVVGWAVWLNRQAAQPAPPTRAAAASSLAERPAPVVAQAASAADVDAASFWVKPPPSLAGTSVDGALPLDAQQNLVIDQRAVRVLEYFLAALGELSEAQVMASLDNYFVQQLSQPALTQARDLLRRYWGYKQALGAGSKLNNQPSQWSAATFQAAFDYRQSVRLRFFSPAEIDAIWQAQSTEDRAVIARIRTMENSDMNDAQKAEWLAANTPKQAFTAYFLAQQQEAQVKARNDPQALQAYRTAQFGQAAAARLSQLDKSNAAFADRVETYLAQKKKIQASQLPESEQARALERSLQPFSEAERLRLPTLEAHPELLRP